MNSQKKIFLCAGMLFVLGAVACVPLTGAEAPAPPQGQTSAPPAGAALPAGQPFEEASAEDFFLICESSGGQVEQWGDGWSCDYEDDEDITCQSNGECTGGTLPDTNAPGYTLQPPVLGADDAPESFVATCSGSGGTIFGWDHGFGCDFDQGFDLFCASDQACGLGWVTNPPSRLATTAFDAISDGTSNTVLMLASLFEPPIDPALIVAASASEVVQTLSQKNDDEWSDDEKKLDCEVAGGEPTIDEDVFVCWFDNGDILVCIEGEECYLEDTKKDHQARLVLLDDFQQGRPQIDADGNLVAKADDDETGEGEDDGDLCDDKTDTVFECKSKVYAHWGDICEEGGGEPTYWDNSDGTFSVECDHPGQDWQCNRNDCWFPHVSDQLDFARFSEAFLAGETFAVLIGPSDIDPRFAGLDVNWNTLFAEIIEMNVMVGQDGIIAPNNLLGTVSIIAPNNVIFPNSGLQGLYLTPAFNVDTDTVMKCGILPSPPCLPPLGLMIPMRSIIFHVSLEDLVLPERFHWVDAFEEVVAQADPETPTSEPTATTEPTQPAAAPPPPPTAPPPAPPTSAPPTAVPPTPTNTPVPDPMNASISGLVWQDANGDGVRQGGEPGIASQIVRLGAGSCASTGLESVAANLGGNYSFGGLAGGTYCVSVSRPVSCATYTSPTTPTSYTVNLGAGAGLVRSFGFQKTLCD